MSITGLVGGQSFTVTAQGAYHSIDDVANHYGADNCCIWLNLGPSDNAATMSARALGVINFTESWVNSWFRRSRYYIPFAAPVPLEIMEICAHLSGSKMYEPRTVDDIVDGVSPTKTYVLAKRKEALDMVKMILSGKMEIQAPLDPGITEAPSLVRTDRMRMRPVRSQEVQMDFLANITLNSDVLQNNCFSDIGGPYP